MAHEFSLGFESGPLNPSVDGLGGDRTEFTGLVGHVAMTRDCAILWNTVGEILAGSVFMNRLEDPGQTKLNQLRPLRDSFLIPAHDLVVKG